MSVSSKEEIVFLSKCHVLGYRVILGIFGCLDKVHDFFFIASNLV